jgi:hypothetical protein
MHGRRRWIAAGLGIAAAAALTPATASAAGLIAAYDTYVPGKGFEIGLKNAQTGANIALPAAVNTTEDELHPALSADGRYLAFTRMRLQPKLNGDIVPPAERSVFWLDRQTGTLTPQTGGNGGAGPVFTSRNSTTASFQLSWGVRAVIPNVAPATPEGAARVGFTTTLVTLPPGGGSEIRADVGVGEDIPHAASVIARFFEPISTPPCQSCTAPRDTRYLSIAVHNPNTGALESSKARLSNFGLRSGTTHGPPTTSGVLTFGGPGAPAGHPVPRVGDGYVALDLASGNDVDIQSISYPGETQLTPAPTPITTPDPERMPAWSPNGNSLGFVRTTAGRRLLAIFDATPGIQAVVNKPVDLGADAPTPQTQSFQSVWGGLSLAEASTVDPPAPATTCSLACLASLSNTTLQNVVLKPFVTVPTKIGIFVNRVTGTRRLLGRTVPRLRVVGRVPLGSARKGSNRLRWDGRVAGKRLKAGTYLLTYRTLRGTRVTSTSDSIRFTIAKSGRVTRVRRQR